MRRKLNKNSVIIIIIIAFFTLSSYSFDQLVIRNEDKLRNAQINLDNLNSQIETYDSIYIQLTSLSDFSYNQYSNLKRANKYWFKQIIVNTDHNKTKLLKDKNIQRITKDPHKSLVYQRFAEHIYEINTTNNILADKYADIYWWHKKIFSEERFRILVEDIFDELKGNLTNKDYNFYLDIFFGKWEEIYKTMSLNDWYDLYMFGDLYIEKIIKYSSYLNMDINRIYKIVERTETLRNNTIENISKISTYKNYFILSSIISQIFSLLFLLILFRNLIKS